MKEEVLQRFVKLIKHEKLSPEEIVFIIRNIVDVEKLSEYLYALGV